MKRTPTFILPTRQVACKCLVALSAATFLASCAKEPERKPVGPKSENSPISWNTQIPGQGMGQFGMMPQNQYRR